MSPWFLLMQVAASSAAPTVPPANKPDADIVVTAHPLAETERALAACLARHCAPKEEIAATIGHAENQFVAGDYEGARKTLLAGRARNARYAAQLPEDVGDLHRANARVASLTGHVDPARIGQIDSIDALKSGLPHDDPRVFMQRLAIGDSFASAGRLDEAVGRYNAVARQAHVAGLPMVEGQALFRTAVLYGAVASVQPQYASRAKEAIARVTATTAPAMQPFRNGVLLLQARLADKRDRAAAIEKALAYFRSNRATEPVLIYAPVADLNQAMYTNAQLSSPGDDKAQWADMSFWIDPDGKVRDITVLRESPNRKGGWLTVVTKAVAERRYAPLKLAPDAPGLLRVERYSLVYDITKRIGSRMSTRSSTARIETTDLTVVKPVAG